MALVAFTMSIALVGNAVAGEKFKWRIEWNMGKPAVVNVPGEEGQIMSLREDKGVLKVLVGSKVMDGMAGVNVGANDMNTKTASGFGHGEIHFTRGEDNMYWAWEGRAKNGPWSGPATLGKGTGKFAGMKGKATWSLVPVSAEQYYVHWEGEL